MKLAVVCLQSCLVVSCVSAAEINITLANDESGGRVFELHGLPAERFAALAQEPEKWFSVYTAPGRQRAARPPLAGSYSNQANAIRFTPRFPLEPGMRYQAVFDDGEGTTAALELALPAAAPTPAAHVAAIYPSGKSLPQNQLKFYVHFTAPMSRGDAYRHFELVDAEGRPLDLPFLELSEELWNPAGDRLTLLLDPARVKRELKPREEQGPVLEVGRRYTLLVHPDLCDARGQPLAEEFRKDFAVIEPDETCPQPKRWRLKIPRATSEAPLTVNFGEPLDHALLQRMLRVVRDDGSAVSGRGAATSGETGWKFQPREPWRAGRYRLVADSWLEDLAGNSIARKFEVDAARAPQPLTQEESVSLEFEVEGL